MSREAHQAELRNGTEQLLNGPLKHVKAAALAAALVPLASLAATPATAQGTCSASFCGIVWDDTNGNGIQDGGESGIPGVKVFLTDGTNVIETTETDVSGKFTLFAVDGTFALVVDVPSDKQASPSNQGSDDTIDSDGVPNPVGDSVASGLVLVTPEFGTQNSITADFGLVVKALQSPGTGTPGYWKNHPEAWPAGGVTIAGVTYYYSNALQYLQKPGKDKTQTIFASLLSARLNGAIGNDSSCAASAIAAADAWLGAHPVGSGVAGGSAAWQQIEWAHQVLDAYNNGQLCAPHRQ